MSISVKGLQGVMDQLKEVSAEMGQKALVQAARAAFKKVADAAKQLVPVDSGDLREAISIRTAKSGSVVAAGIVVNASSSASRQATIAAAVFNEGQSVRLPPARRWHFVELGTNRTAAKPFIRPALDQNAQAVVDDLNVQLKKKIAAAIKKASRSR